MTRTKTTNAVHAVATTNWTGFEMYDAGAPSPDV